MNNSELYLKKVDETIEYALRKKNPNFNVEYLINYIISKININSNNNETTNNELQTILIKLLHSHFGIAVRLYCYYLISNFNHEFSEDFLNSISSKVNSDIKELDSFDIHVNALRNYLVLTEKSILENLPSIEQLLQETKNTNYIINSFYFSNFPLNLLMMINKINFDEYRTYKQFLIKFYIELTKRLFVHNTDEGAFLNLLKMLTQILNKFTCYNELPTKERIVNSIIIQIAEYLMLHLEELISLLISIDHKLLIQSFLLPIHLYKIYNYYRDYNNPCTKYERQFHRYLCYIFTELRNVVDPEVYSEISRVVCEFKIIENEIHPQLYSSEIIEINSKFLELSEHFDKNTWFDTNLKILSKLIDYVDYTDAVDLTLILLSNTKNVQNLNDRIITTFNLFTKLIMLNIDYSSFFGKESLILCLFKQDWFVFLVNKDKNDLNHRESRWRHDLFICLIEALFKVKSYIIQGGYLKKYLTLFKICQDIIDVCFKIIDWADEGEAYKMYFLALEETCLFFDDPFYCVAFCQDEEFMNMKKRLEDILIELSKRFLTKDWNHLVFANENSKYKSLLLLSQFLSNERNDDINNLVEVIRLRLVDIPLDSKNERFIEEILRSCLFLGVRTHISIREKIITYIAEFVEKIHTKSNTEPRIVSNILTFSENILNYLIEHKTDPQIVFDNKIVEKLKNDFFLIIPKDIENNIPLKTVIFNNLYLINLCENSILVIENACKDNTSIQLEYYKKYLYYSLLEYNNDSCHMLINSKERFIFSEWTLITGISDAVHIYYMFKIDIENREIELFIKNYNSTSCVLNNVIFTVYFSHNLLLYNESNLSLNYSPYVNSKEFYVELLSPFSNYEFSVKFYSQTFEKNNITVDCSFDMMTDQNSKFTLNSDTFYVPLTYFLIPDTFSLYETKKFDIFYNTLNYAFTCKCFTNCSPDEIIKQINKRVVLVEYKTKNKTINMKEMILEKIKEMQYPDYFKLTNQQKEREDGFTDGLNDGNGNQIYNFRIKLSCYSVYNFWIYILILGDYNFQNNKSILNIEVKTNELQALKTIWKEKAFFFNELMNQKIKFY
jgi:hypothetical protein